MTHRIAEPMQHAAEQAAFALAIALVLLLWPLLEGARLLLDALFAPAD